MLYEKRNLPKKSENLADWYNRVVLLAELADYGPARGTMVFRPYGYSIWENIQKELDKNIKAKGVENAYFPLFIPESLLKKEKEHVEGFAPELAVVTIGGGEELKEKLIVRPTSETIMYHMYAKWIQSWRDLPVLINQWNNVVRWEKRTYLFLRTSEFLWQEGHTAHATHEEALEMVYWAMSVYEKVYRELLAMPGCAGRKSEAEKFAGAVTTITYETLMPEGKALQSCTSHDLGQNFSKPFDIKFQTKEGKTDYVWQTSWGLSTRAIGGMLMMHGDDLGLRLPPRVAPIQVVILPVKVETDVLQTCDQVAGELKDQGVRVLVDSREDETLGYKINKWELKGVPLRIEIGEKEIESQKLTAVRRDSGERLEIPITTVADQVKETLENIQTNLFEQADTFLKENTHEVKNYEEFKKVMETTRGFIRAFWCENPECEAKIKEETKTTPRCLPLDAKEGKGECLLCGGPAKFRWLFGQAY
jgi:prolyl-tRNA synthetase